MERGKSRQSGIVENIMPNTIAQNKFATHCSVSRQGIASAVKAGLIAVYKKKINIDHRKTCEYYFSKTGKQLKTEELLKKVERKKKVASKAKPIIVKPAPSKKKTTVSEPEPITAPVDDLPANDPEPDPDDGYKLPKGINSFEDITIHNIHLIPIDLVKKWKELEGTKTAKQTRDTKRGKLIERDVVYKFISKLYAIDVSQIKTQEDRLVPALCGVFGVQDGGKESFAARKLINDDSADLLESIKRDMDDFLSSNEATV